MRRLYTGALVAALCVASCACSKKPAAVTEPPSCQTLEESFPTAASPAQRDRNADFGYLGLHVGDAPSEGDRLLAERFPTFMVTRAMCGDSWQFRAGNLHDERGPFCDLHQAPACELIYGFYRSESEDKPKTLFGITYVRNFDPTTRPTVDVMQELQRAFGSPVWRHSMVRRVGSPDVPQETALVFVNDASVDPGTFADERFAGSVIRALAPRQLASVRLEHPEDRAATGALQVEIFGWSKATSAVAQQDERQRE